MSTEAVVEIKVINGEKGGNLESLKLEPSVFGIEANPTIIYDTIRWQRLKRRSGTHATLTKGMMKGCGRKPRKQKGGGTSRAGSASSPLWVGGGVAHGPQPRNYRNRLPVRTRALALAGVLSDKIRKGKVLVVDSFSKAPVKTKLARTWLNTVGVKPAKLSEGLVVLVAKNEMEACQIQAKALRNLDGITILPVSGANVFDILNTGRLLCSVAGIQELETRVTKSSRSCSQRSAKACSEKTCTVE